MSSTRPSCSTCAAPYHARRPLIVRSALMNSGSVRGRERQSQTEAEAGYVSCSTNPRPRALSTFFQQFPGEIAKGLPFRTTTFRER